METISVKLEIGNNCTIIDYKTRQKGYGRQELYLLLHFSVIDNYYIHEWVYAKDVFPNVKEHYNIDDDDKIIEVLNNSFANYEFTVELENEID